MAVAHDAASESADSVSVASFNWTHTPTGTPRGVLVFVVSVDSATPLDSAVSYGGTALTAVTGGLAADAAGEAGTCQAWFLGSSVPTGAQSVVVTRTNNANFAWACAVTVTASNDTEVTGVLLEQADQALTEENVNDGSPGTNSVRYMGLFSGKANPVTGFTDGANSTRLHDTSFGGASRCGLVMRETTAGQGARPVGVVGTSDDVAAVYLAVKEAAGGGGGFTGAARIFGGWSSPLTGLVVR
jgi:hypothetical protein